MIIIGAGYAGLLAGVMLPGSVILEKGANPAENHKGLLRFSNEAFSKAIEIPFRQTSVLKAIDRFRNPVADAMFYSQKTTGSLHMRSIAGIDGESVRVNRWLPPDNLWCRMATKAGKIVFGVDGLLFSATYKKPIISTVPMPVLMDALAWPNIEPFRFRNGHTIALDVPGADAYFSLYIPAPGNPASRVSMTGSRLVIEIPDHDNCMTDEFLNTTVQNVCFMIGVDFNSLSGMDVDLRRNHILKILPYDEEDRRRFIRWASEEHGIYSLGRYATWRPGLVLDALPKDVRAIKALITTDSQLDTKGSQRWK